MGRSEHTLSRQDTVCTPQEIWGPIVDALGPIIFDPCGNPASTVPALVQVLRPDLYWTDPNKPAPAEENCGDYDVLWTDGLSISWKGMGLTYVNPPYSTLGKEPWVRKARDEADESVMLVPVRTSTQWWQRELIYSSAITFLESRVTHDNVFDKEGNPTSDPSPFGQALVYNGPRVELWLEKLGVLGWTVLGAQR